MHDAEAKACITVHRHELSHKRGPMTGNTCIFVPELLDRCLRGCCVAVYCSEQLFSLNKQKCLQYKLASAVGKKGLLVRETSVIAPR